MQETPKHGLGQEKETGRKKKKKAGERRSHMTVLELRYGPDGKLERSLETGGGTGLPIPSDA